MFINKDKAFASIGVNCLPEVQFIKRLATWKGVEPEDRFKGYNQILGPFDTGGVTPEALIKILNLIKNDTVVEELGDIEKYYPEVQPSQEIFYGHKTIQGFTLTHEDEDFTKFAGSIKSRFENFINLPSDTTLLWSNAQANFTMDFNVTGNKIQDYYLTQDRYDNISKVINDMFGFKIKFAVRDTYTDRHLLSQPNVFTVDIPFGNFNLFGSKKSFDHVFKEEK